MDKMGADFFYSVQTIIDRLGKNAIPVQIPIGKESDFIGLIDLFEMDAYYYKDDKGEDIEYRRLFLVGMSWISSDILITVLPFDRLIRSSFASSEIINTASRFFFASTIHVMDSRVL